MNIILLNTHSFFNTGDAAIVLAQINLIKKIYPDSRISLTSRTPEIDKKIYQPLNVRTFNPIIPAPSVFKGNQNPYKETLIHLLSVSHKVDLIQEIKASDLVISSGGGYLYSYRRFFPGPMFIQNMLHVHLAQMMGKPVMFFPQSFGPLMNPVSVHMLRKILDHKKTIHIFARENISCDFLFRLLRGGQNLNKVELCPDLAFSLPAEHNSKTSFPRLDYPRPIVVITVRKWDFPGLHSAKERKDKQEEYLSAMAEACRWFYSKWGGTVVIVPHSRGPGLQEDDRIISKRLWRLLVESIPESHLTLIELSDQESPDRLLAIYSQADLLIATRFHSAIFALIRNVPVISVSYQPKSIGIMGIMELGRYCLSLSEIKTEKLTRLTEEILTEKDKIKKKIRTRVEQMRQTLNKKMESALKQGTKYL